MLTLQWRGGKVPISNPLNLLGVRVGGVVGDGGRRAIARALVLAFFALSAGVGR